MKPPSGCFLTRSPDPQATALHIFLALPFHLRYCKASVRRFLSIMMLLLSAFPLVAPALGQTAPQAHVLLCCRMMGAHHCMTVTYTQVPVVHPHCPALQGASSPAHTAAWIISTAHETSVANTIEALKVRQVEAGYRISFYRSRQKRGPPASVLS